MARDGALELRVSFCWFEFLRRDYLLFRIEQAFDGLDVAGPVSQGGKEAWMGAQEEVVG